MLNLTLEQAEDMAKFVWSPKLKTLDLNSRNPGSKRYEVWPNFHVDEYYSWAPELEDRDRMHWCAILLGTQQLKVWDVTLSTDSLEELFIKRLCRSLGESCRSPGSLLYDPRARVIWREGLYDQAKHREVSYWRDLPHSFASMF